MNNETRPQSRAEYDRITFLKVRRTLKKLIFEKKYEYIKKNYTSVPVINVPFQKNVSEINGCHNLSELMNPFEKQALITGTEVVIFILSIRG